MVFFGVFLVNIGVFLGSLWFLVVLSVSWSFLVVLGGSLWFMVCLRSSWLVFGGSW